MRLTIPTAIIAVLMLAGCTTNQPRIDSSPAVISSSAPVADSNLPFDAMPDIPAGKTATDTCPYLDTGWVEQTNGQRVTAVGVDTRFDTPACVFWSYPDAPQLTTIVRHMPSKQAAISVTDWAAPINNTEPEEYQGWSGGRSGGADGAIYAVQKDTIAVVVFSNQEQSLKAELVAKEIITQLGL